MRRLAEPTACAPDRAAVVIGVKRPGFLSLGGRFGLGACGFGQKPAGDELQHDDAQHKRDQRGHDGGRAERHASLPRATKDGDQNADGFSAIRGGWKGHVGAPLRKSAPVLRKMVAEE